MNFVERITGRGGSHDTETGTLYTTPWSYRTEDGVYVGFNREVWLYRSLPTQPLEWEDATTRLSVAAPLFSLIKELGETSKDTGTGGRVFSFNRHIHLVSVSWEGQFTPADGVPDTLADWQRDAVEFLVPNKALLVGVKLRSEIVGEAGLGASSVSGALKGFFTRALGEDVPDLTPYRRDLELVNGICARAGASVPTRRQLAQLESWYNQGNGTDAVVYEAKDCLYIDQTDTLEFASVMSFNRPLLQAPYAQWLLEAATHPEGARMVSIRAELEPGTTTRSRLRRSQRRVLSQMAEEQATGDLDRVENTSAYEIANQLETYFATGNECLLTNTSIVMARRSREATTTYADELSAVYGIEMKQLQARQLVALDETLPCSSKRVSPFLQDLSIGMVAYAGLQGFSSLGDRTGLIAGLSDPDYTVCLLDPFAAPRSNKPPAMAVFGDPGSGKTYLAQLLATQAALAGVRVFFINPKGFDTLSTFAEYVAEQGAPAEVVRMSGLETEGGYFDPFRFCPTPQMAAEVANSFILSVLGPGFTQEQELQLGAGLKRGALAGARSVGQAMSYVADASVKQAVAQQMESSVLFRLGIAMEPLAPLRETDGGLTLIEFDRKLELPGPGTPPAQQSREQRINLAAIRLVTRASLEILSANQGGMMVLDEAWTFLSSPDSLAAVQSLGREGRSQNILPIFATQKVADLVKDGVDLESYLSRVFCMQMTDERDARVALRLCGLEDTDARVRWLSDCGPRRPEGTRPGRPAAAVHRDLASRHAAITIGPAPADAHTAFTTNPEDKKSRDAARAEAAALSEGDDSEPPVG